MENVAKIVKTKKYAQAKEAVYSYYGRIRNSRDQDELITVHNEKQLFFDKMKADDPLLYSVFQLDDVKLTELAMGMVLGKPVTLL